MSLRTQCGCAEGFCLQNGVLLRSINQRPRTPQPLGFSREGREQPWTYHQRPGQEVLCLLGRLCLWESLSLGATFSQTNLFLFRRGNAGQRGACWAQVHRTSHHCAASSYSTGTSHVSLGWSVPGERPSTGSLDSLQLV